MLVDGSKRLNSAMDLLPSLTVVVALWKVRLPSASCIGAADGIVTSTELVLLALAHGRSLLVIIL